MARTLALISHGKLEEYKRDERRLREAERELEHVKKTLLGDEQGSRLSAKLRLFPLPVEGTMEAEEVNGRVNDEMEEEALPGRQVEEGTSGDDQILTEGEPSTLPPFLQDQEGEVVADGKYCHYAALRMFAQYVGRNPAEALPRVQAALMRAAEAVDTCSRCREATGIEVRTKGHNCPYNRKKRK